MADISLDNNNFNPHEDTHSIFFRETKPTEMTLFSHISTQDLTNDVILLDIHRTNNNPFHACACPEVGKSLLGL